MWHGVFATDVTHILLGNPWLKERDAYHDEEAYTSSLLEDVNNVGNL